MLRNLFFTLFFLLLIAGGVLIFNTIRFGKELPVMTARESFELPDSAVHHLQEAIRYETISWGSDLPQDSTVFNTFRQFLEKSYPLIHSRLERRIFGNHTYLYEWKGKNNTLSPFVLMAHYDVVPVEEASLSQWTVEPFGGMLKENKIWGRGAVDDKGSVIAILEAAEKLLAENFIPERTVYISLGHNEEIGGIGGAADVAAWFGQQQIRPALVLDEGGMITREFKGITRPVALISTAEKGYISFELTTDIPGGHSSQPKPETSIDVLSKALYKLREEQMSVRFTEPIIEMFARLGKELPVRERIAFANRWLFKNMIAGAVKNDGQQNALFHSTIVPTILQAGIKDNVIPSIAKAVVNARILPGDSIDDVENFIHEKIDDERVVIKSLNADYYNSPRVTPADGEAFRYVEKTVYETVKDVIPVPFQLMGTTDSRHFQQISDGVIRFTPFTDVKGYHGIDEHIELTDFRQMIFFYYTFINNTAAFK